jgi:hypothetical protein
MVSKTARTALWTLLFPPALAIAIRLLSLFVLFPAWTYSRIFDFCIAAVVIVASLFIARKPKWHR